MVPMSDLPESGTFTFSRALGLVEYEMEFWREDEDGYLAQTTVSRPFGGNVYPPEPMGEDHLEYMIGEYGLDGENDE